jgi:hypothetical protein
MASETVAVRMHVVTKKALDNVEARINKGREKAGKAPMTKAQVIALAIESLEIKSGVDK